MGSLLPIPRAEVRLHVRRVRTTIPVVPGAPWCGSPAPTRLFPRGPARSQLGRGTKGSRGLSRPSRTASLSAQLWAVPPMVHTRRPYRRRPRRYRRRLSLTLPHPSRPLNTPSLTPTPLRAMGTRTTWDRINRWKYYQPVTPRPSGDSTPPPYNLRPANPLTS